MTYHCALCGKHTSHNAYYCSTHDWHLCWDCVHKAALTNELTCPNCGKKVRRVD
ncbi:MAG TPA: hypothetical protein VG206_04090 [Terriglobia bacterium]|nr:hypothetical protein [Terriglobia bacterium]